MSTIGKWVAGILATIISTSVVWQVTQPNGLLNHVPVVPQAPHAPRINNITGQPEYDEKAMMLDLKPGERQPLKVMELWSGPVGLEPSCASGFLLLTWQVREPYPIGGEDLLIEKIIPRSNGRTEPAGRGSNGSIMLGYCDEASIINNGLTPYLVELRYASGMHIP